jgi:hypothetical protein
MFPAEQLFKGNGNSEFGVGTADMFQFAELVNQILAVGLLPVAMSMSKVE